MQNALYKLCIVTLPIFDGHLFSMAWLIQKKSGKTPLETIHCTSLYKPCRGSRKLSEDASRYHKQKNIADWCSNHRKILPLVTPSFFVVRPFLSTSLLIYIYFPTSNKMAIIGTRPSRFSDKKQQLYKGSLIRACA